MNPNSVSAQTDLAPLIQRLGPDRVIQGAPMTAYATDVYRAGTLPLAVVQPQSVDDVQAIAVFAHRMELAVFVRGGGASYTDGYLANRPDCLLIDLSGLDKILEINAQDGYVLVEAGVTWAQLKSALDPLGLRTPFFGPFSGIAATIGGSLSQNAISHGSGAFGPSAQSVLSIDVVIASGEMISTGSAARGGPPVQRWYGPDMCGLFLGDCGALGIKVRAALPLLAQKPAYDCASFAFDQVESMARFMQSVARERLDDENFAIDAALAQGQISRQSSPSAIWANAMAILNAAPNRVEGLVKLARFGLTGTSAMSRAAYMAHYIVDGTNRAEVRAKLKRMRKMAVGLGTEIPPLAPNFVRAMPFAPLFNTLGPNGERWVPIHGILAPSRVGAFHKTLTALYESRASDMKRLGVWTGGMFESVGASGFLYEIAFYWPGVPNAYHQKVLGDDYLNGLKKYAHNDEAASFVEQLKSEIIDLYGRFDATHFQLGKAYPYAQVLTEPAHALIRAIKRELDPKGLMNPGALGLK